ncbi:heterokaryon incompatibility protein-domain-containing protein [Bisporella sp. PMI_857]|nr:heterokaryon incompatibility protein-domain-containing protein [Bisporella sp. PMI_857]
MKLSRRGNQKASRSYIYKPLGMNGIRLLSLMPGPPYSRIKIKIFHSNETRKYEALSYVWGSTDDPGTIYVRKRQRSYKNLNVTQNLLVALNHLRHPTNSRILWIDAICINQEDDAEKSIQVARMGEIFAKAAQVIVWLGPEADNSSLAIETLSRISCDTQMDYQKWRIGVEPGSWTWDLEQNQNKCRSERARWNAIKDLLNREYFTRLWINQEIRHATEAVVRAGEYRVPWVYFAAAILWIHLRALLSSPISDYISLQDIRPACRIIIEREKFSSDITLLELTKTSHCRDPRDRIYAINSLLSPGIRIQPDYLKRVEDTYKAFTLGYINRHKDLGILGLCEMKVSPSNLQLPSWVPNFSVPNLTSLLFRYRSSGPSSSETKYNESYSILDVHGILTATIIKVTSSIPDGIQSSELLALIRLWEPPGLFTKAYWDGASLFEAFVSTLIGGQTEGVMGEDFGDFPSVDECTSVYMRLMRDEENDASENLRAKTLFLLLLRRWTSGRAFFTTDNGYIGLCPVASQPGDQVIVALGADNPLILRLANGSEHYHQVVGECYLHGMMHGEAFLGRLPVGWGVPIKHGVDGSFRHTYTHGNAVMQDDPRLGPLPEKWILRYSGNSDLSDEDFYDEELNAEGEIRLLVFWDTDTNEGSRFDPRLTSAALRERGVSLTYFHLV